MLEQYLTQLKAEIFVGVVIAVVVGIALWHIGKVVLETCAYIVGIVLGLLVAAVVWTVAGLVWAGRMLYRLMAGLVDLSVKKLKSRRNA